MSRCIMYIISLYIYIICCYVPIQKQVCVYIYIHIHIRKPASRQLNWFLALHLAMGQAAIQPVNPPATLRSARAAPGASRRPRMGGKRRADASPRSRERGEGGWRGVEIGLGLRLRWKNCLKEKLMSWSCNKLDFCFFLGGMILVEGTI